MRLLPFLALASLCVACDPPADPAPSEPAWTDGPAGHVYVNAGPLYDIDARDGRILREIDASAAHLQATADHAYFTDSDAEGTKRVFQLGLDDAMPEQLGEVSSILFGTHGGELVGVKNSTQIIRTDLATGAVTMTAIPAGLDCQSGSISAGSLYLACLRYGLTSVAGMIVLDLDADTFGPFVEVKTGALSVSMSSNVTATPAGVVFVLYEGEPSLGTRTAYKIDGTGSVGVGVPLPGSADDLDEQAAIGNVIYSTMFPSNQIVPFDVATMRALPPIALDRPRHLRAGGELLWVGLHDGGGLARVVPASGETVIRSLPTDGTYSLDSLAYGGE